MFINKVINWITRISRILNYVSMVLIFLVALIIFLDILLRAITKQSILGTYEITEMCMVVIIFGSLANTQLLKGHVRVTMLLEKLPLGVQRVLEGLVLLITAGVCAIVCYSSFVQASLYKADEATTGVLKMPYYPFAYFMAIGLAVFTVVLLLDSFRTFLKSYDDETLNKVV
ncbi:MAG: TRAP transporter small permease [Peptococcaceae bacterium]|nr:TRAP transporter small permease [Peptococcaceae bacterium]